MRIEEEQGQRKWRVCVRARSGKFRLRLEATNEEPSWKLLRFSIFLRLHQLLFHLKSQPKAPSIPRVRTQKTTKSKLPRFLHKFRTPPPVTPHSKDGASATGEPKPPAHWLERKEPIGIGALLVGSMGVLGEWVSAKEERAAIVYGVSSILVFLSLVMLLLRLRLAKALAMSRAWRVCLAVTALASAVALLALHSGSITCRFT